MECPSERVPSLEGTAPGLTFSDFVFLRRRTFLTLAGDLLYVALRCDTPVSFAAFSATPLSLRRRVHGSNQPESEAVVR
jgi:hypothetical protein